MPWSMRADERAAVVFDDVASALDAGLPLPSLGADPRAGDDVLGQLMAARGVRTTEAERNVLRHAWRSGRAGPALRTRAAERRRRAEFARELRSALAYPLLLLAMVLIAAVATSAIIGSAPAIAIASIYAVTIAAGLWLWWLARSGRGRPDEWPLVGALWRDLRELPYLETLGSLYGAGVPLFDAHRAAVDAVRAPALRTRLEIADRLLHEGQALRDALAQATALELETRSLLATGEQSGQLEDALQRALVRRQQVATSTLRSAARRFGHVAYALAVVGVVYVVFSFYAGYFRLIGR